MVNKLDWFDWVDEVVTIAIMDGWSMYDSEGIATSLENLYEQGDTPEEAYRKYQEGEV